MCSLSARRHNVKWRDAMRAGGAGGRSPRGGNCDPNMTGGSPKCEARRAARHQSVHRGVMSVGRWSTQSHHALMRRQVAGACVLSGGEALGRSANVVRRGTVDETCQIFGKVPCRVRDLKIGGSPGLVKESDGRRDTMWCSYKKSRIV